MHHDRVTVGRRFRRDIGAYAARCAAAIVDDELLPHVLADFLQHDAADYVIGAAGRPRNNHADGLGWISLRCGHAGEQCQRYTEN